MILSKRFNRITYSKILILLCFFFFISATSVHKYHVSITKMEYVKEKEALQIISRIYIEDLEHEFVDLYENSIVLDEEIESEEAEFYIERYLLEKIKIKVNDEEVELKYLGKEYENDQLICYMEVENVNEFNSIEVFNKVLFNESEKQENIVRITNGYTTKSVILTRENKNAYVTFVQK